MNKFWIASDSSFTDGPFSRIENARNEAKNLGKTMGEKVTVFSGPGITNWVRVETVKF